MCGSELNVSQRPSLGPQQQLTGGFGMRVDTIDPARTAMIVVDMQNDFVAAGAPMETLAARAMVPRLAEALKICRDAGTRVIYTAHVHRRDGCDNVPQLSGSVSFGCDGNLRLSGPRLRRDAECPGSPRHSCHPRRLDRTCNVGSGSGCPDVARPQRKGCCRTSGSSSSYRPPWTGVASPSLRARD